METKASPPFLSMIIPTFNRAGLLQPSLESLVGQSVPHHTYEVVVVDDGSSDSTAEVCQSYAQRLPLKYFRIDNSGISAAKNLGIFAASGSIVLFFDDDDVANQDLVRQHIEFHKQNPDENLASLGYTTWSPSLRINEVMHYVTDVGHFLFSYSNLTDGQVLDYTYFWGGRSSCKRSLLVKHGIFNQEFRFGSEDIELAYRLTRFGLKVVYNRNAIQYMNRALTYEEFCLRCERQGASQAFFSRLHADPAIQDYCQVVNARGRWQQIGRSLDAAVARAHELEELVESKNGEADSLLIEELRDLYRWTFNAFKLKGIVEALPSESTLGARHGFVPVHPSPERQSVVGLMKQHPLL